MKQSKGEQLAEEIIKDFKVKYEKEYRFHKERMWRFDFAFVRKKIAVEIEGGVFMGKGHTGGKHFESDCEKYNEAQRMGWKVYRFTTRMVENGELKDFFKKILK